jgi:phage terminase large subunit GpA-like protein
MTPADKEKIGDRLEAKLRKVFRPDDGGDIVKWLEDNIRQIPFSPMPSGFRVAETPWLAEPLRAFADPEIRLVQLIAPIQSGKSLAAEMLSCFIIARQPAPTLYLNDQDSNAADWMQSRLRVLWENVPAVLSKLTKDEEKKKAGTVQTADMTFWCLGAFNEKNLQRRSIRWLIGDETWLWPQGHLAEASARVTSFGWLGKRIFMSQGSFQGDDTEACWQTTDKRTWSFACPECGFKQPFKWEQIRIPENATDADGDWNFQVIKVDTTYECEGCLHRFKDTRTNRDAMNANGFYAKQNPTADDAQVGFHWNALAARSWGGLAEMYLRAKNAIDANGDAKAMQIFEQKQLAKFWSDAPDAFDTLQAIGQYKMGDAWGEASLIDPATRKVHNDHTREKQLKLRFMTVDVQRNGFYCLIRAWALGGESRLHKWKFVQTWEDVAQLAKVNEVIPAFVYVDCGDQFDDVIRQCGINKWTALRGDQRYDFPWRIQTPQGFKMVAKVYAPARLVNVGTGAVRVHHFSNLALKDQLSRLRRTGKHSCANDAGQDYLDQMDSEVRVKNVTGKPEWKRIGKRANHLWDCEVMQFIPALAFGLMNAAAIPPAEKPAEVAAPVVNAPEKEMPSE